MTRTRVKICGTTGVRDALLAQEAGADAVGLIFAPSRRRVGVETARAVSLALDPAVGRVGVFSGADLDEVLRAADAARLSAVQIHDIQGHAVQVDDEARELYLSALARSYPVLRVLRPQDALPPEAPGITLLFDAPAPGSGQPLDWASLRDVFPAHAWLAGGLGPHNVAQAVRTLSPAGVDAVSHLEASPGVKDPAKVRAFVREVRGAEGPGKV